MDFKEQYKHPKWQKKRLEILERDEYICQSCGDHESTLHVHHRFYEKNTEIWDYDNSCLITLCDNCHTKWHKVNNEFKLILPIEYYIMEDYLSLLITLNEFNPNEVLFMIKTATNLLKLKR